MSVITHNGSTPPTFKEWFDPDSSQWVWFSYPANRTIVSSSWILPSGTLLDDESMASSINVDGITYSNSNGAQINFNGIKDGVYIVTNRVTFSDGVDDKSARLIVRGT